MGEKRSKILIVDDEEVIRFAFKSHLSKEGYEIYTASDFTSSLDILANNEIDVVIADIILGKHTGIEILRKVKRVNSHCPVIMITGEPNIETAADAVRIGAFDYIPKPVRKEMLLRVIHQALQHKALVEEKERYRENLEAIFGNLQDAILTVDKEMHILEANEATRNIFGFSPETLIGKDLNKTKIRCLHHCVAVLKEILTTKNTIRERRAECGNSGQKENVLLLTGSPLIYPNEKFVGAILVARDISRLNELERELKERDRFHNIIGKNQKMQKIYRLLEDLAEMDTTVLITGESGTGKELVARALHYEGLRSDKRIVSVSCSALSENLLESELFGHVKGAFTGAEKDRTGRFQLADGGSIFLDEIGEISPYIQLKLLRVLQERELERVGDPRPVKIDVRIIAATNRNLKEMMERDQFRKDLYYRLKVVEIELPPLRERKEDIPLLVAHIQEKLNRKYGNKDFKISEYALDAMMVYSWPGNIRELENALEHAIVHCKSGAIEIGHLPPEIRGEFKLLSDSTLKKTVDRQEILNALKKTDWNKAKAARLLGIGRRSIYRKIEQYKIICPPR